MGTNLPEIKFSKLEIKNGLSILDILSNSSIVSSKSEARRTILNKGIKLNNKLIEDDKKIINLEDFGDDDFIKLSCGKKKHYLIKLN